MKTILALAGRIVILGLIILGFAVLGNNNKQVAGYQSGDPNAPKLEIAEKRFDFGKITLQDVARHEFKIRNTGKNPLVISDIMTSCHCTSAKLKVSGQSDSPEFTMGMSDWNEEIPPDIEGIIEVVYTPAKMPVSGQVSRVVTFNTNDPNNQHLQLEIIAEVE